MEIIKKNLILCIVLLITVALSATFIVFIFIGNNQMRQALSSIEMIKTDITELQRQRPTPHKTNLTRINTDIEEYKTRIENIYQYFGQPQRDAFIAYIGALGMTEKEFMNQFEEFWTQNAIRGSNKYQLFIKFNNLFNSFKLNKAREIFREIYQKTTIERVNESNINDILMYTFGVPRSMSPMACKSQIAFMQEDLLKMLDKAKVSFSPGISTFTFGTYLGTNTLPPDRDIPHIMDNFIVIGDLVQRIIASGIKQIEVIDRANLNGFESGKFTRYRYTIEVIGRMEELRSFFDLISKAYIDRRIYIVRNVTLEKRVDKAYELTAEGPAYLVRPTASSLPGFEGQQVEKKDDKQTDKEKEAAKKLAAMPFNERPGYGATLVGSDKFVKMIVELDYVEFNRKKFTIQE